MNSLLEETIDKFFAAPGGGLIQLSGPSGCGKTTFGIKYVANNPDVMFYDTNFDVFTDSIENNIRMGRSVDRAIYDAMIDNVLSDIKPRLTEFCNNKTLSTGQIQRINFVRNLIHQKNSALIMDEPLSNVNSNLYDEIISYTKEFCTVCNVKILMISHTISTITETVEF